MAADEETAKTQGDPLPACPEKAPPEEIEIQDPGNIEPSAPSSYLSGWRLHLLTVGLCLSLFLSALDITIVSTSLISISNDLQAFAQSSWIINGYLVTYFSFLIIWAKCSDIFGRKLFLSIALVIFLAFSGACGGARTAIQLIIFRALQGIGGAGIFSMVPIVVMEMVPTHRYAAYNAFTSATIGISFLLGPLIGGAINDSSNWRWVFLINIPVGCFAFLCVLLAMPKGFPNHANAKSLSNINVSRRLDYPGFLIFLGACLLLVCALEEAGVSYAWSSSVIITLLVLSGVLFLLFIGWQWLLEKKKSSREPVFPNKFLKNRVLMGVYLNLFLSGAPFTTLLIELPQKFQAVNNVSAIDAGIRLLPFSLSVAVASISAGIVLTGGKVPPVFALLFGLSLQVIGIALLYVIPADLDVPASVYGYESLAGFGCGFSLTVSLMIPPFLVDKRDLSVALGGVTQFRILGGTVGVAIATNLLNSSIKSDLVTKMPDGMLNQLLGSVETISRLDPGLQTEVRLAFAKGYQKVIASMLGFTAAEIVAIVMLWERKLRWLS